MCVVSAMGDEWNKHFDPFKKYFEPPYVPYPKNPILTGGPTTGGTTITTPNLFPTFVTKDEYDKLKEEVELMKKILKRAKLYDEETNQPNCELEEKVAFLKKIAEAVGVDLEDVFGPKK